MSTDFENTGEQTLVRWWNDGSGSLAWLTALEETLKARGYTTRSDDPTDGKPRVGGERLLLVASVKPEPSKVVGLLQRTLIGVRAGKSIGEAMDAARDGYRHSQRAANVAMAYIVQAGQGRDADTSASYIVLLARDAAIGDKA